MIPAPPMPDIAIGSRAIIDGDHSLAVTVTALTLRNNGWTVECDWWNGRQLATAAFAAGRVTVRA